MGRKRLDPAIFNLPVERMRAGYYSDKYFVRTREVLLRDGYRPRASPCRSSASSRPSWAAWTRRSRSSSSAPSSGTTSRSGRSTTATRSSPGKPVMLIEGPYDAFAHLETLYLGVLARRTRVGTNTRRVVEAARPKEVMFFPARHDHWLVQTGDGYAAHIAGAIGVSTDAQASWWGSEGVGHGAPRHDRGVRRQHRARQPEIRRPHGAGDQAGDPGRLRERLRPRHRSSWPRRWATRSTAFGSTPARCWWTAPSSRRWGGSGPPASAPSWSGTSGSALDRAGYRQVKIVVSGGFTVEKIQALRASTASRWTRTASARRSSRAASTSPPTWCGTRAGPARRSGESIGRIRGWRGSFSD